MGIIPPSFCVWGDNHIHYNINTIIGTNFIYSNTVITFISIFNIGKIWDTDLT